MSVKVGRATFLPPRCDVPIELAPELPAVNADPRRIVQVMVNLLANADRYSP